VSLIERALDPPLFGLDQHQRERRLFPVLAELTRHHVGHSAEYRRIVEAMFPEWEEATTCEELPFLPVGLFKQRSIRSIPDEEVFTTITSSGTSGSVPSRVVVDRATASRQTRALTSIMGHVLGNQRRPMLLVDTDALLADRTGRTARAAGVVGMMTLGRKHVFLMDGEMKPRPERLGEFVAAHRGESLLIFGFTFMVWQHLVLPFENSGIDLSGATLVHSGGWKNLESQSVDNREFRRRLERGFGLTNVVNFYGMAEQVGSVFIEGDDLRLHPSTFAEVIIRDPDTWRPQPIGQPGVVQVLSAVPLSYPGHSILTEDLGVIDAVDSDDGGLGGRAFRILGRLPRSELRGCSDTYAESFRG